MKLKRVLFCPGVRKTVWLKPATQDVALQGHVEHFLDGQKGVTWACAFANMANDPKNRLLFPHPVAHGKQIAFAERSTLRVLTGEEHGGYLILVEYNHGYGSKVDMNDEGTTRQQLKKTPEIFEQEFQFRAPTVKKRKLRGKITRKTVSGPRKNFEPKGSMARAIKAGFLSVAAAKRMKRGSMSDYDFQRMAEAIREQERKRT